MYPDSLKSVELEIRKPPYGVTDQADFLNGCMEIKTLFTPEELLDGLHEIEAAAGRKRIIHWAPGRWTRTLFSITIWCMYRNS